MKLHQLLTESDQVEKTLMGKSIVGKSGFEGKPWNGYFDCSHNELTSLEGAPSRINGDFYCSDNFITSLEGAPSEVDGSFFCSRNKNLTSLKNIHEYVHTIKEILVLEECPIKSHVLGVLKIKDLKRIYLDNEQVEDILNTYLPVKSPSDIVDCQEELFRADLDEYAQF